MMDFPDKLVTDETKNQAARAKSQISRAEEFYQKKVPLVDVMNSIKEIRETMPTIHKLESKVAIQEDRITELLLFNERGVTQQEINQRINLMLTDNEKRLREIIRNQEERWKEYLFQKVDTEDMQEKLKTKASKVDYGDLYKKYCQLYTSLEPIILNQDLFKRLCIRVEHSDQQKEVEDQILELKSSVKKLEIQMEKKNAVKQQVTMFAKQMSILEKQVQLLYDDHIYSIDESSDNNDDQKKKQKQALFAKSHTLFPTQNRNLDQSYHHHSNSQDQALIRQPTEDEIHKHRTAYQNVFGYSEKFLEQEKILKQYKIDKILKYLQLQINEMCDRINQTDHANNDIQDQIRLMANSFKDFHDFKFKTDNLCRDISSQTASIQEQLNQLESSINNDFLNQSKIHGKFKLINQKLDEIQHGIDSNNDKSNKEGQTHLKRIIQLESDCHQLLATTKYLRSLKTDLVQLIHKEIQPIKQAKQTFDRSRIILSENINRLEQKLDINYNCVASELDNIKEPLKLQINDIIQEKDGILRELAKVYQNNRDLTFENFALKDESLMASQNNVKTLLNQTMQSWHSNSKERKMSRFSDKEQSSPDMHLHSSFNNQCSMNNTRARPGTSMSATNEGTRRNINRGRKLMHISRNRYSHNVGGSQTQQMSKQKLQSDRIQKPNQETNSQTNEATVEQPYESYMKIDQQSDDEHLDDLNREETNNVDDYNSFVNNEFATTSNIQLPKKQQQSQALPQNCLIKSLKKTQIHKGKRNTLGLKKQDDQLINNHQQQTQEVFKQASTTQGISIKLNKFSHLF